MLTTDLLETTIDIDWQDDMLCTIPAWFDVDYERADRAVGERGGWAATLDHICLGGLVLKRAQVVEWLGEAWVQDQEELIAWQKVEGRV